MSVVDIILTAKTTGFALLEPVGLIIFCFTDGSEIGRSPVSMINQLMAFPPTCDAN